MTENSESFIHLKGVETNNLKNIEARFPLGKITVVTGCSGSGKSSLVFHSLFAESQRRYLESLSSFSRQYIKSQAKPKIKEAVHLLPAIAIKQARALGNNRSTVGSLTEVAGLLEVIFFHLSEVSCPSCHETIKKKSLEEISSELLNLGKKSKSLSILAPLTKYKDLKTDLLLSELKLLGFSRLWSPEKGMIRAELLKGKDLSQYYVVVDRLSQDDLDLIRILESAKHGFQIGSEKIFALDDKKKLHPFSQKRSCLKCKLNFDDPKPSLFSFNSPIGACPECQGYGQSAHIDWEKAIPKNDESISSKGLSVLDFGTHTSYYNVIKKHAKSVDFDLKKAFKTYTKKERKWLQEGDGEFEGLQAYFDWLESKKYKPHYRMHLARYRKYKICATCDGERYKQETLFYKINNKNIADIFYLNHDELFSWLKELKDEHPSGSEELSSATEELENRLLYLQRIGLAYLSSNRLSNTLSGGELQRIKMSRCLGNYLTQTLFCLDEPSSGLHPRDTEKLIGVIKDLKDQGNTVVVVEHEKSLIEQAEHLIQIGPGSGHSGGIITYEGKPKKQEAISQDKKEKKKKKPTSFLELSGAQIHNLKNLDIQFPLESLIGICGVSGSGKTSLIKHTLYPLLCEKLYKKKKPENLKNTKISIKEKKKNLQDVFFVSQEPIGRSSRSTIATYLGIFDEIRKTFAVTEESKRLKLTPKEFSFNSPGGRCEFCKGKGQVAEELSFLGSVDVTCPECSGKRFTDKVLSVPYKGYSILEILSCCVDELGKLFPKSRKIQRVVKEVSAVGLGYMTLGQELSSFSGGEAQRLKLLSISLSAKEDQRACLIFDEPTSGLSDDDVKVLLKHFRSLTEDGHTVIVVEHHTRLLAECDWLIELGPEASHNGGQLIFEGNSENMKKSKKSVTGVYL